MIHVLQCSQQCLKRLSMGLTLLTAWMPEDAHCLVDERTLLCSLPTFRNSLLNLKWLNTAFSIPKICIAPRFYSRVKGVFHTLKC